MTPIRKEAAEKRERRARFIAQCLSQIRAEGRLRAVLSQWSARCVRFESERLEYASRHFMSAYLKFSSHHHAVKLGRTAHRSRSRYKLIQPINERSTYFYSCQLSVFYLTQWEYTTLPSFPNLVLRGQLSHILPHDTASFPTLL